jgi:hypothetical protein
MGGGQSLNFGLAHLDTFAWVGGFSSAPNTKPPGELVPDAAAAKAKLKLLWISCGNKDGLIRISQGVHTYLKPQDFKAQADAYARLFSIFIKHKDAMERVTFWGLSDRRTWRYGQHPLIFDSDNQRKPAYAAIVDAILHPNPVPARPE